MIGFRSSGAADRCGLYATGGSGTILTVFSPNVLYWCPPHFFLICIVGGGIKVHSTLRPLNGLSCQPRVIMIMEKSVEWLAGETEVLGENLPQCRFVLQKTPHAAHTWTRAAAVGSQHLTAELRYGPDVPLPCCCNNLCSSSNTYTVVPSELLCLLMMAYNG
jgi:hypothetical protein